jgi:hypothetical protein
MISDLIYTGPGAPPSLPNGAEAMDVLEVFALAEKYKSETGDKGGDVEPIVDWIRAKHGDAKADGFKWRCSFAI